MQLHEAALLLRNPAERRGNLTVRRRTSEVSSYYREPGFHHHRGHHAPGPGVAITNAVFDTLHGDYISGSARMMEAFVVAASVAMGIVIGLRFIQ